MLIQATFTHILLPNAELLSLFITLYILFLDSPYLIPESARLDLK